MRSPNIIQVLLRVRSQKEEVEERKLSAIIKEMQLAQAELARVSTELELITTRRLSEIQRSSPNTHHQAVEAQSRTLWRKCADHSAEIERLRAVKAAQMSAYLSARREREVIEHLNEQRRHALEAERHLHEQKLNEDLFLGRRVAQWDTLR